MQHHRRMPGGGGGGGLGWVKNEGGGREGEKERRREREGEELGVRGRNHELGRERRYIESQTMPFFT